MTRSIIVPALAGFAAAATVMLASPVMAQGSNDYRCTGLMQQAQTAAANSQDAAKTARAQGYIRTGVALCNDRAAGEGARSFRSALRILNVEEVRATDANMVATSATVPAGN